MSPKGRKTINMMNTRAIAALAAAFTAFGSSMPVGARESVVLSSLRKSRFRAIPNAPRRHFYRGNSTNGVTVYNLSAWELRYLRGIDAHCKPAGNKLLRKVARRTLTLGHPR